MAAETTPQLPPSVRLIHRLRDTLHRSWRLLALGFVGLLALNWLSNGIYTVENGESAALLRFGHLIDDAVGPGLHLALPLGLEIKKVRSGEVSRLELRHDFEPKLALVTSDANLITATAVVQYRISRLKDYLYATENPELLLEQVVRAALLEAFAKTPIDEVLTSAKASIQQSVRQAAQAQLERYQSGILVVAVNLQSVDPPQEAANSFREVSNARAQAAQEVNQAEGQRGRSLRLTRGQADKILAEAHAAADSRKQQASGAAQRFDALLKQYRVSRGQTRTELYNSILQDVLPRTRLILLGPGDAQKIDVHLFGDAAGALGARPPALRFDGDER